MPDGLPGSAGSARRVGPSGRAAPAGAMTAPRPASPGPGAAPAHLPGLPANRAGISLKPRHYGDIVATRPPVGWFEVHAENYMGAGGPPHRWLERIRADWPLSIHGVGLSIGSAAGLDADHLARLAALVRRYAPAAVSEHLAWSSHGGVYFADLLPLPYTTETLARVCEHIDRIQTALGRPLLLENPSTYIGFESAGAGGDAEIAFLGAVARRTGCGLLLDINNVQVSATNHGFDPVAYLAAFPIEAVGELHLAGHATDSDDAGRPLLIDTHDRPVADPVWTLYAGLIDRAGAVPTLIEWDQDLPDLAGLVAEAARADAILQAALHAAPPAGQPTGATRLTPAPGGDHGVA